MTKEEIYEECAPALERFFANKVSLPYEIEDLMHTSFLRLFAKMESGAELEDPCAFIFGIAKLVLYEHWRRKARLASHEEVGEHPLVAMGAGLSSILAESEEQALVADALREVRLDYQTVLELFYWEGKSYEEIAATMEIAKGTVGTLLRRGRRALRQVISRKQAQEGARAPSRVAKLLERSRRAPSSRSPRRAPHHGSSRGGTRPRAVLRRRRADESSVDGK
ncbi:MAG: sigma-70 family RNA polymerase sigma factor [Myxococcales bacterium]|nr:sigma-70 family RNA polymerase sigma factor [Myxococcales bacterium]MCB9714445.1 sigma-70 family RNA polymerase sigma factor [Myxococcales bacterium]